MKNKNLTKFRHFGLFICLNILLKTTSLIIFVRCITEIGWRALVNPANHPVSEYQFDVLIGADGKRNTLEGNSSWLFIYIYVS